MPINVFEEALLAALRDRAEAVVERTKKNINAPASAGRQLVQQDSLVGLRDLYEKLSLGLLSQTEFTEAKINLAARSTATPQRGITPGRGEASLKAGGIPTSDREMALAEQIIISEKLNPELLDELVVSILVYPNGSVQIEYKLPLFAGQESSV
jgi:hypothetical protein